MRKVLVLLSLLWTFNLFANTDLFKENTVEVTIKEAVEVLKNQNEILKLVVTGELKSNVYWNWLTEAVRAREKIINLDLSKLKGLTKIGGFSGCEKLAAITLPDSVTTIDNKAFYKCTSLTSMTLPDSVTSIGDYAFYECKSLTSVIIPGSVTTIDNKAFYKCTSLTSVTIPDSVTSIEDGIFENCTSLTTVTIPDSVTSIGKGAFESCKSLTSVTIPDSVTFIGSEAFYGCSNLKSMTFTDLDCTWYSYKVNSNYVIIANIEQLSTPMNLKNPVANVDYFKYFKKHLWFKRK